MPFEKGRPKTGGRQKGSVNAARRSSKFVEQLKGYKFNYPSELAEVLLELKTLRKSLGEWKPTGNKDLDIAEQTRRNEIVRELQFYYGELKSLLPYMAPKLREKEVEVTEPDDDASTPPATPPTDEEVLKMLEKDEPTLTHKGTGSPSRVGTRDAVVSVPASAEVDSPNLAGEQEED